MDVSTRKRLHIHVLLLACMCERGFGVLPPPCSWYLSSGVVDKVGALVILPNPLAIHTNDGTHVRETYTRDMSTH